MSYSFLETYLRLCKPDENRQLIYISEGNTDYNSWDNVFPKGKNIICK